MKSGNSGDDSGGWIDKIKAVTPGIAHRDVPVPFHHEALQGRACLGDGGHSGGNSRWRNPNHSVALDGDVNVSVGIHCDAAGINQIGGLCAQKNSAERR